MKLLTDQEILLRVPTDEEVCRGWKHFEQHVFPGCEIAWLEEGTKKGLYQATTIQIDGFPSYVLYWHKNRQSNLVINAAISLTNRDEFKLLLMAGRLLAKQEGCRGIEFCTKRRGLVEKILVQGGHIIGIYCDIQ